MIIRWIDGFGWNTVAELGLDEDIEICLAEREIAIKYWLIDWWNEK